MLADQLVEAGKDDWARQEFDNLRSFEPAVRVEAWRRTSGLHRVRGRRSLGAVRALWEARDELARERDVTPGRLIPDSAIVAAATAMPTNRGALMSTPGFHGRGASRFASTWLQAIRTAAEMDEADLPSRTPRGDGPPAPRAWAEKSPVAARRLELARAAVSALAEQHNLPAENLLTPDHLRRVMWEPPSTREPGRAARAADRPAGRARVAELADRADGTGARQAVLDADEQVEGQAEEGRSRRAEGAEEVEADRRRPTTAEEA